jgi:hypothetical protein
MHWEALAEQAEISFRTIDHPLVVQNPWLRDFPFPVQRLIAKSIQLGTELYKSESDESVTDVVVDETTCSCFWYRKYGLPCQHLWYQHLTIGCLKQDNFNQWSAMWEEGGFELYFTRDWVFVKDSGEDDNEPDPVARRAAAIRLRMKECLEMIRSKHFELEEKAQELDEEAGQKLLGWWLRKLTQTAKGSWLASFDDFLSEHPELKKPEIRDPKQPWDGTLPSDVPISSACN